MNHHHGEAKFEGNIVSIRAVEDAIRATRKYTEGVWTKWKQHPTPIQGGEFPSKFLRKYYEFYPDVDIDKKRPLVEAIQVTSDWLWGDIRRINIVFQYDYRTDKAALIIEDGTGAVKELANAIPNFSEALARVIAGGNGNRVKV